MSACPTTSFLRRCAACAFVFATALLCGLPAHAVPTEPVFGVMLHYLPGKGQATPWQQADVDALAQALADMRAQYLVLTLGQNSGQFIGPNPTLVALCPEAKANEPRQDLPMVIGQALAARGVGLILYLPFRAPQDDAYLMRCLGDRNEQHATSAQFTRNWSAVIGYWARHYGGLVKGWWFDGVYNTSGMSQADWTILCNAANRGGSARLLAFNAGEGLGRFSLKSAPCQNLMAGELLAVPFGLGAGESTLRFHVATPLTASWGRPGPARFSALEVRRYIADARTAQGMFTLDVPLSHELRLAPEHVALVRDATRPLAAMAQGARP